MFALFGVRARSSITYHTRCLRGILGHIPYDDTRNPKAFRRPAEDSISTKAAYLGAKGACGKIFYSNGARKCCTHSTLPFIATPPYVNTHRDQHRINLLPCRYSNTILTACSGIRVGRRSRRAVWRACFGLATFGGKPGQGGAAEE